MPVIAIGAAIAADVVAGAAVAGTVGGIAAISTVTAFEVVAAVGATIAAVGAVTRDKTLTMVGGAIGLVGGIGGLAASAGVLGASAASNAPIFGPAPAASAAGSAADTGATFADSLTPATTGTVGGAVDSGAWTAADAASANTIPFVADGLPAGQNDLATFSSVADKASDPATTLANTTNPGANLGGTPPTGAIDPATGLPSTSTTTNTTANGLINQNASNGGFSEGLTPATAGTANGPIDTTSTLDGKQVADSSVFGSILKFANDNKTLVAGAMTVGGKLLEGISSTVTPAQVNALNAQAAANNAAAALANMQRANLQMPKAVASSAPVTGSPGPIIPSSGAPGGPGIINQPRLAPVTGAPV